MSEQNEVIVDFTISKRINEASTTLDVKFTDPTTNTDYDTGKDFQFEVEDETLPDGFIALEGLIEKVDRDDKDQNKIFSLNGRDAGRLLTKQPFNWDCTNATAGDYTFEDILELILVDTGISIGRGQKAINEEM